MEVEMSYPVSPFANMHVRARGEPDPKWLQDDSAAYQNKSLQQIVDSLRKAREIMRVSNDAAEKKAGVL
jgi:hypothetical protein